MDGQGGNGGRLTVAEVVAQLAALADPQAAQGMACYGITGHKVYGVRVPQLRRPARSIGRGLCSWPGWR